MHTRYFGAQPQRADARTRGAAGLVGVTHVSVRINDDDLEAFLDDRGDVSETVRTALRYLRAQEEGVDDHRLTDHQRAAYTWLRDRVGVGGTVSVGLAKNRLAQTLSVDMDLVKGQVLRPLESHGYIRVQARVETALITVLPPSAASEGSESSAAADDPEGASERLDDLAAAGKEVAESAD